MKMTCDACHTNFDAPDQSTESAACPCCEHVNRPRARAEKIEPTHLSVETSAQGDDPPIKTLVFPTQAAPRKPEAAEDEIREAEAETETAEDEIREAEAETEAAEITRPRTKNRKPPGALVVRLTVLEEGKPPCRYVLEKSRIVLGRGKCDVKVHDPEVSREHCAIETNDGVATLRDLKSANGTVLNGHLVNEHALKHGDQVTIGTTLVKIFLAKAA